MAVHGLSLAEGERYILAQDPAHPDNIKAEYDRLTLTVEDADEKAAILAKIEADAGKPTIFILGNLLQEDRVFLGDMSGGMEQTPQGTFRMTPKNFQKAAEAVRRALKGWENFTTPQGDIIPFATAPGTGERGQPRSFVSPETMMKMHLDIVRELSARILELNGITGALEKKLQAALLGESGQPSQDGPATNAATETKSSAVAGSQV